jgi:hypothetical protein
MMNQDGCKTFAGALAASLFLFALLVPGVARAERFSHKFHEEQDAGECRQCHKPGAVSIIPPQAVCLPCHKEKELADTPLGPSKTHTAFWLRQHGDESAAPRAQCRSCHASSFCVDCHAGGEIGVDLRRQAGKVNVPPRPHTPRFLVTHPLKAEGLGGRACEECHKRSFCTDCHEKKFPPGAKAPLSHRKSWQLIEAGMGGPLHAVFSTAQCQGCHPGGAISSRDWSAGHAEEARRNLSSCRSCHPDGDPCIWCHSARDGLKVSPHPGNWRQIQKKFRKQSPKVCEKCHSAGSI